MFAILRLFSNVAKVAICGIILTGAASAKDMDLPDWDAEAIWLHISETENIHWVEAFLHQFPESDYLFDAMVKLNELRHQELETATVDVRG